VSDAPANPGRNFPLFPHIPHSGHLNWGMWGKKGKFPVVATDHSSVRLCCDKRGGLLRGAVADVVGMLGGVVSDLFNES
jgi:hypothetical protein